MVKACLLTAVLLGAWFIPVDDAEAQRWRGPRAGFGRAPAMQRQVWRPAPRVVSPRFVSPRYVGRPVPRTFYYGRGFYDPWLYSPYVHRPYYGPGVWW